MDVFDAADFADLLPRRWKRRLAMAVVAFALLFPSTFQDWYLAQVRHRAAEITTQFEKILVSQTTTGDRPDVAQPRSAR